MVTTRVSSVKSPWLANVELGDEHIIPISHGEGRFVAPKEVLDQLIDNGQVAFQYVDPNGNVTMEFHITLMVLCMVLKVSFLKMVEY